MVATTQALSIWAQNIAPSPTLAVDSKAKALVAEGKDVCSFGAGEPDFDTPAFIKEACIEALRCGHTKYGPAAGIIPLREALVDKYARDNNMTGLKPTQIVVSPGGKYSCMLAIQAVVGPGDEVLIPAPYWVSYPEMVKLSGGIPVSLFAGKEQDFKLTPEQLKEAIGPKTRMLLLNNPSNPTGAAYRPEELKELVSVAVSAGLYVMSDEIYEYLLYDDAKAFSPASMGDEFASRVITVSGFSKTFSMTGWRLGTLVASEPTAKACGSIQSQTTSGPNTFAQYGALKALKEWEQAREAINGMLEHFDRRRKMLLSGLESIEGIDCPRANGAFYLFPHISSFGLSSNEYATRLLEEQQVAVVPGEGFGAPGYIRLSYATADEILEKGLKRIKAFCQSLH